MPSVKCVFEQQCVFTTKRPDKYLFWTTNRDVPAFDADYQAGMADLRYTRANDAANQEHPWIDAIFLLFSISMCYTVPRTPQPPRPGTWQRSCHDAAWQMPVQVPQRVPCQRKDKHPSAANTGQGPVAAHCPTFYVPASPTSAPHTLHAAVTIAACGQECPPTRCQISTWQEGVRHCLAARQCVDV
jgi:hypothetical protein